MARAVAPAGAPDRAGHHSAAPQPTTTASTTRPRAGSVRQGPAPAAIPAANGRNHQPSAAPRPSSAAVTAHAASQARARRAIGAAGTTARAVRAGARAAARRCAARRAGRRPACRAAAGQPCPAAAVSHGQPPRVSHGRPRRSASRSAIQPPGRAGAAAGTGRPTTAGPGSRTRARRGYRSGRPGTRPRALTPAGDSVTIIRQLGPAARGQPAVGGVRRERVAAGRPRPVPQAVRPAQRRERARVQPSPGPLRRRAAEHGRQVRHGGGEGLAHDLRRGPPLPRREGERRVGRVAERPRLEVLVQAGLVGRNREAFVVLDPWAPWPGSTTAGIPPTGSRPRRSTRPTRPASWPPSWRARWPGEIPRTVRQEKERYRAGRSAVPGPCARRAGRSGWSGPRRSWPA